MAENLLPPPPKKGEAEVLLPPPPPKKKGFTAPQTPLVVSPTSLPQESQGGLGGSVGSVLAQTLPTDNKPFSPEVGAGLAQGVKAFETAQKPQAVRQAKPKDQLTQDLEKAEPVKFLDYAPIKTSELAKARFEVQPKEGLQLDVEPKDVLSPTEEFKRLKKAYEGQGREANTYAELYDLNTAALSDYVGSNLAKVSREYSDLYGGDLEAIIDNASRVSQTVAPIIETRQQLVSQMEQFVANGDIQSANALVPQINELGGQIKSAFDQAGGDRLIAAANKIGAIQSEADRFEKQQVVPQAVKMMTDKVIGDFKRNSTAEGEILDPIVRDLVGGTGYLIGQMFGSDKMLDYLETSPSLSKRDEFIPDAYKGAPVENGKLNWGKIAPFVWKQSVNMAPIIAAGAATQQYGSLASGLAASMATFATTYDDFYNELSTEARNKGINLSRGELSILSSVNAAGTAAIEQINPLDKIFKGRIIKRAASDAIEQIASGKNLSVAIAASKRGFKEGLKVGGLEVVEEIIDDYKTDAVSTLANQEMGGDFATGEGSLAEIAANTAIATLPFAIIGGVGRGNVSQYKRDVYHAAASQGISEDVLAAFAENKDKFPSESDYNAAVNEYKQYERAYKAIPNTVDEDIKYDIANKVIEKNQLADQITKDTPEVIAAPIKERIAKIEDEITNIYNRAKAEPIQESAAAYTPTQEQPTPQTDVELRSEEAVTDIASGTQAVGEVSSGVGQAEGEIVAADTGTDVNAAAPEQVVNDGVSEGVNDGVNDGVNKVFYTGRGKKYEDLSKTKGDFIFFTNKKENAEYYGGDESNVSEAFIDDSEYLDLTSQEKKAEFVDNNFTDEDIAKLYKKEISNALDRDRFNKLSEQDLINEYRERAKEDRYSGDNKEQKFLLDKAKKLGIKGIKLLDTFFGKYDISTIVIDKSTIKNKPQDTKTEQEVVQENTAIVNDAVNEINVEFGQDAATIARDYINSSWNDADTGASEKFNVIMRAGVPKIRGKSFKNFVDKNKITKSIAQAYFNKEGMGIDEVAQEMTDDEIVNPSGVEITTDDLGEFMLEYPSGAKGRTPRQKELNKEYMRLTGKSINSTIAKSILKKYNEANPQQKANIEKTPMFMYATMEFIEDGGDIDWQGMKRQLDEKETYFTVFPFGIPEEDIPLFKQFIDEKITEQQSDFDAAQRGFAEDVTGEGGVREVESRPQLTAEDKQPEDVKKRIYYRGGIKRGVTTGFYTLDSEEAFNYTDGKGDNVTAIELSPNAKVLELVVGDYDTYEDNPEGIAEYERITGKKYDDKGMGITTSLWGNTAEAKKLKSAGYDAVIGSTMDGHALVLLNKSAAKEPDNMDYGKMLDEIAVKQKAMDEEAKKFFATLSKSEPITEEVRARNLAEVTELGWDNVPQAMASIAKRTGKKYEKWDDIPQAIKVIVSTERNKEKQDAIQVESTAEVPLQPEARISEEVAEGTPQAEPKGVTEKGQAEIVIEAPQPVTGTPNEQQKTYNSAIQYFRSVADGDPKDVRKMITDYIKANRKYLNETANAKALRLVNSAKTEEKVLDALEYLDKLVNNAKFAKQVELADKEFTKGKRRMAGLLNMSVPLSKIRTIDAGDIRDGELLEKAAAMLANPTANSVQAMNELANEIVAHVEQNAKARAAKSKEKLKSYDSISDALDTLFTEEVKDEQGNKITADKKIETVRQLSYYAGRIRRIEEAIAELSATEDMLSPAQLTALENKADLAVERLEAYANGIKEQTTAKLSENLSTIREAAKAIIKDESPSAFSQQIKNRLIEPLLDIKDDIGIYASEKLLRDVEDMMSGYIPRDMFKTITRATNKQAVEAVKAVADNTSTADVKSLNDISKQGGIRGFVDDLLRATTFYGSDRQRMSNQMRVRRLTDIDAMSNLERSSPYNKNFVGKWIAGVRTYNEQSNIIKQKFFTAIGNPLRFNTISPKIREGNIKVGAYLLQQQEQTQYNNSRGNVLEASIRTARNNRLSLYHKNLINLYEKVYKQYPDGVQYSDLTESEKKKVDAFRNGLDKLMPYQEASNAMRGEAFNALPDYVPLLYVANVGTKESTAAIDDNSRTVSNELLSYNGEKNKNAKLRSDRGLNRNPNAELGFLNLDIESIFSQTADQVLKEYYLYPIVYSSNSAMLTSEQQLPDGMKSVPQSLRTIFNERVAATFFHGSSTALKIARNSIKGTVGISLGTVARIVPEVISGYVGLGTTIARRGLSRSDVKLATGILANSDVYEKLTEDNATGKGLLEKYEDKISKGKSVVEKAADVIFSPDSVAQLGARPTLFAMVFTDEFKKATGEKFNAKSYMNDAGYAEKYKQAIKDAYNVATAEAEKVYPLSGKADRPTKIVRWLPVEYGKDEISSFAYDTIMTLAGYAQRAGITTNRAIKDIASGANYGRVIGGVTLGTLVVSTALYQYLADLIRYAPTAWYGDDEDEKEEARKQLEAMYDSRYHQLQLLSAMLYLKFTRYGSLGRAILIGGGVASKEGYSNYLQTKEINLAEYDLSIDEFDRMFTDATYRELKPTAKLAWQDMLLSLTGGFELIGKNVDAGGKSIGNAWEAAMNGDEKAINMLYAMGMMYSLIMPPLTGARPIPYIKSFKNFMDDSQLSDPELMTTEQFVNMRRSESRRNGSALRMMADDYVKAKKAGDTEKMQGIDRVAEDLIYNSERKLTDPKKAWATYQKNIQIGQTPIKYKRFMDVSGDARAFAIAKEFKALQKKNDFEGADNFIKDVEFYNMLSSEASWNKYQEYVSQ